MIEIHSQHEAPPTLEFMPLSQIPQPEDRQDTSRQSFSFLVEILPYHVPGITRFVYSLCRLFSIRLVKYLIYSRSDLNVDITPSRPNRR